MTHGMQSPPANIFQSDVYYFKNNKKKQHINDLHGLWYIELGFKSLIYYLLTL